MRQESTHTEATERTQTLAVRVSSAERVRFTDAARKLGLTTAAWLRMLGLQASGGTETSEAVR